jgi:hypothetical protein
MTVSRGDRAEIESIQLPLSPNPQVLLHFILGFQLFHMYEKYFENFQFSVLHFMLISNSPFLKLVNVPPQPPPPPVRKKKSLTSNKHVVRFTSKFC